MPVPYDVTNPDPQAARRIFLDWLRANPSGQLDRQGDRYEPFVERHGQSNRRVLTFHCACS